MSVVATRYGKMRVIDSDNVVSRALALYGEWAMDELILLEKFIVSGMSVLDVGAFIGTHTLAFSKFTGESGKVYSFEPRKEIFTILSENITQNNCINTTAFNIGLAEKEYTLSLEALDVDRELNYGGLEIDGLVSAVGPDNYQMKVSTIDSLGIDKIDVIKIDAEGMEVRVLEGAVKSIMRNRPIIFAECNSLDAGNKLLNFCNSIQYESYGFLPSAFNPGNFNANRDNIFGSAKESALVLIPNEKKSDAILNIINKHLLTIAGLDDLVLLLLHKPQYPYEVLALTKPSSALGINYPSPGLSEQIVGLNKTLQERDEQIVHLQHSNEKLVKEINEILSSISWCITQPLRTLLSWWNLFNRKK